MYHIFRINEWLFICLYFARNWLLKRTFLESGLGVFQIELTFKAAMDGYPLGKICQ